MTHRMLPLPDGYALLKTIGVPVPDHGMAVDRKSAEELAARMGSPLVMKIVSPGVVHKSDVGGVMTGIDGAAAGAAGAIGAGDAFDRIVRNVKDRLPEAEITGVLIERQVQPGLELLIGGKTDHSFGKVLTVGLGGTMVEIFRDIQIRVLPIDENEISGMLGALAGYPLLSGYRSGPPLDVTALKAAIRSVASFFFQLG